MSHVRTGPIIIGLLVLLVAFTSCDREPLPTDPSDTGATPSLEAALSVSPAGDPVRVIVQTGSMAEARSVAASVAAASGLNPAGRGPRVLRTYNNFPLVAIEVAPSAVDALRRAPGVRGIQFDIPEPPSRLDASLPVINADAVHTLGWDGSGITIAILDTGIDEDHPFFENRIVSQACYSNHDPTSFNFSLCPGNATSSTADGSADINTTACNNEGNLCDHGTHVAGIAAGADGLGGSAPAAGTAPAANIIAIQVFTRIEDSTICTSGVPCVQSYPSDQIAGLDRVFDLRNTYTIAAANMSLGGGMNTSNCDAAQSARKTAIDQLLAEDIATIVAAGNSGFTAAVAAPACITTAVAVGATDNADALWTSTNRGTLLDLFAPGVSILSSGSGAGYETKSGTSMATPHVTGAWAILRQVLGTSSVTDILNRLQSTGVDITYSSGGVNVTTPRIDLLGAIQTAADPPVLTVDTDPVTVDEGQTATNTGTFASDDGSVSLSASIGTVADAGGGTWSWSFNTTDGPTQSQTVTITGTDELGQSTDVTFELVVNNVAPTVTIDPAQTTTINENTTLAVNATFTDPGTGDTHTASITCHTIGGPLNVAASVDQTAHTVTGDCPYGDDSDPTFEVTVTVTDDDNGAGDDDFDLTVDNVDPAPAINTTGLTLINGVPTVIAQVGDLLDFEADATDPGSDDLDFTWDWDDGSTTSTDYLVNPPSTDPLPSPDVDPRNVNDMQQHTFATACLFLVDLTVTDDDGGSDSDQVNVIIGGNSGRARSSGFWLTEMRANKSHYDDFTVDCYLAITGFMSAVFHEVVDASSQNRAARVLMPTGKPVMSELLDVQLLAAWLNFANGAFAWTDLVDTDGDKVPDTAFDVAILAAEAVRLDPASTAAQLEAQKNILESINLMHE